MGHTHRASCPVAALQAYFEHCKAPPGASLFHFQTGCPLTSRAIRAILRDLLLKSGYNTSKYNTHSLWIGAATAAAQVGLPSPTIQRLGRWSSTAYTTYTRHLLTLPSDTATVATNDPITQTHTHTHTHTCLPICTTTWNQSAISQSIWGSHLGRHPLGFYTLIKPFNLDQRHGVANWLTQW